MPSAKLSIIIPVYNEAGTIAALLDRVAAVALPVDRELIVVNDGSTDGSGDLIRAWRAAHPEVAGQLLEQANQGKGGAVRTGIGVSTGTVVIIQDADLEYDPADYAKCIAPILRGEAQVVYGSRELLAANRHHSSWLFYLGGVAVSAWFSVLYFTWLTDEPTCYKTFAGDLIRALAFSGSRFEWEPEVTAKLLRLGYRIHEVPISYRPRRVTEGKKIRASDGFRALWEAWRWRFKSLAADRERLAQAGLPPR